MHGRDERTRVEAWEREVVRRQITEICRNRSLYEAHVQKLLHEDAADHEQHSLRITKNWSSINAPIFRESYRRLKRQLATGMRSIRDYFSVRQAGYPAAKR